MAFNGTVAGNFLFLTLVFLVLKLLAATIQIAMMRGNYRDAPKTSFYQLVYVTGKVTPFLAAASAFVSALLLHDSRLSWFFGCFAIFVAVLALYVVRLRRQRKFFGLLDLFSSKRE
jgi:Ca2+/Na+ antiporter